MERTDLQRLLGEYLPHPTSGERAPATFTLDTRLLHLLDRLAQEQAVPVDALVEHLLFRQLRAVQARLLVDEPLEPVPASFVDPTVAAARARLEAELAARTLNDNRGDRALEAVQRLEEETARLGSEADREADELRRRAGLADAVLDEALDKRR